MPKIGPGCRGADGPSLSAEVPLVMPRVVDTDGAHGESRRGAIRRGDRRSSLFPG